VGLGGWGGGGGGWDACVRKAMRAGGGCPRGYRSSPPSHSPASGCRDGGKARKRSSSGGKRDKEGGRGKEKRPSKRGKERGTR
jgi:hypothetical protein